MSAKNRIMFAAIGGMVAVAAVLEFLIVYFRRPIYDFVYFSPYVSWLQIALVATGCAIVAISLFAGIKARLKHGKRPFDKELDHVALRGFAIAMLLLIVLCLTLCCAGLDAGFFEGVALLCLGVYGSVVAVRNNRWGWIIVYLLIFLFAGLIFPAGCCLAV